MFSDTDTVAATAPAPAPAQTTPAATVAAREQTATASTPPAATTTAATTTAAATTATTPAPSPGGGEEAQRARTTGDPSAGAPASGSDCGKAAGGFVRTITTNGDCPTAAQVAEGWVAALNEGKDPERTVTVQAGAPYACDATFQGELATVSCRHGATRIVFTSHP